MMQHDLRYRVLFYEKNKVSFCLKREEKSEILVFSLVYFFDHTDGYLFLF